MDIVLTFTHLQIIHRELSLLNKKESVPFAAVNRDLSKILRRKEAELSQISGLRQRFIKRSEKIIVPISFKNLNEIHKSLEEKMSTLSSEIKIDVEGTELDANVNVTDSFEGNTAWFYSYLNTFMAVEYYVTKYRSLEY